MSEIRLIEIREDIMEDNAQTATDIRRQLGREGVFMLNLMASPGSGKTSLILETIRRLRDEMRIVVIEGDIASSVDAEKVAALGIPAVQLRTGGACHLDASMIRMALEGIDPAGVDMVLIENVGNLVCPAEFDTGAQCRAMILSVPEGDDKPLKYPLMFSVCEALVINKIDYLPDPGFDMEALKARVLKLNPDIRIFAVSCRTGAGLDTWAQWLRAQTEACRGAK